MFFEYLRQGSNINASRASNLIRGVGLIPVVCQLFCEAIQCRFVEHIEIQLSRLTANAELYIYIQRAHAIESKHTARHRINVDTSPAAPIEIVGIRKTLGVVGAYVDIKAVRFVTQDSGQYEICLLYTSDAADE